MNKIYKVKWSKVKHQYVVVSELVHNNGKQSGTPRKSLRSRIATPVVCGVIAAFGIYGALPTQQAFAENETINNTLNFPDGNIIVPAYNRTIQVGLKPGVILDGNIFDNDKIILDGNKGTINATNSKEKWGGIFKPTTITTNEFDFNDGGKFVTTEKTKILGKTTSKVEHTAEFNEDGATFTETKGVWPIDSSSSTNIDGGTITVSSDTRKDNKDIIIDGNTGKMTGLSNTTWNEDVAKAAAVKGSEAASTVATQGQLQQAVSTVATEASKHTKMTVNGGNKAPSGRNEGKYTDGNLQLKQTVKDGQTTYDVKLNDDITLGNKGKGVSISGTRGTISATDTILVGVTPNGKQGIVINSGKTDSIVGLDNTTWKSDEEWQKTHVREDRAATEGQLKIVSDKTDEAMTEAEKHTEMTVNGGREAPSGRNEGKYTGGNLQLKQTEKDGQITYDVKLNDDIKLGNKGNGVFISGNKGTINVTDSITVGDPSSSSPVTIGDKYITGLDNTTWKNDEEWQEANVQADRAATEGQLQQAISNIKTNPGWKISANQEDPVNVTTDNNTVDFSNSDENIVIDQNGTNLTFDLNDDITLGDYNNGNGTGVYISGNKGTINVTDSITVGDPSDDSHVTIDDKYITGLDNTTWEEDNVQADRAATEGQLQEAISNIKVNANGGWKISANQEDPVDVDAENNTVDFSNSDENIVISQDDTNLTFDLNDDIKLGNYDNGNGNGVFIGGTKGTIDVTNNITVGDDPDSHVTIDDEYITGLDNTIWTDDINISSADKESEEASKAATQGQLSDVYNTAVKYNDDFDSIMLEGSPYVVNSGTHTGGTHIYNVAYASGEVGSEAVNVDYLNDTINDAIENATFNGVYVTNEDKHLVANPEDPEGKYRPDEKGNIDLVVENKDGEGETVTITDVAKASDVGNRNYNEVTDNTPINNGDDVTTAIGKIDNAIGDRNYSNVEDTDIQDGDDVTTAIGKIDNKIENIATQASSNNIDSGSINDDGTISLNTKNKERGVDGVIQLEGQLDNSVLTTADHSKLQSDGEITLISHDGYDNEETSKVILQDVASKTNLDNLTSAVGASTTTELKESYKGTNYINGAETMVDADVALDTAIYNVQQTSYANDMYLNQRIDNVEGRLSDVEGRIDKVGAMAAAIANLRTMGYDPEAPTEIAVGIGQYRSETGLALGIFHYPNKDFMLSASISTSGDEIMAGIGATWRLGRKTDKEKAKDEESQYFG